MQKQQLSGLLFLLGTFFAFLLIPPHISTVRAKKGIGISHSSYERVEVTPNMNWTATFTTFNAGDEDVEVYAEIRGAPGIIHFYWQSLSGKWVETFETIIPVGERRYANCNITISDIEQDTWYNWSMMIGYYDYNPKSHAAGGNGIQINMIWPMPPPVISWYEKVPWFWIGIFTLGLGFASYLGYRIRKGIIRYQRMPTWEERKEMEEKNDQDSS